jgi:hypothetical protein
MATTVEITSSDDGTFLVGIVDQPSADVDDQQQVQSIDQALKMAGHLLQSPPADNDTDDAGQKPGAQGGGAAAGASGAQAQGPSTSDASAQSSQDIWNQLAQQNMPPH